MIELLLNAGLVLALLVALAAALVVLALAPRRERRGGGRRRRSPARMARPLRTTAGHRRRAA
jgi:hypothetical protein